MCVSCLSSLFLLLLGWFWIGWVEYPSGRTSRTSKTARENKKAQEERRTTRHRQSPRGRSLVGASNHSRVDHYSARVPKSTLVLGASRWGILCWQKYAVLALIKRDQGRKSHKFIRRIIPPLPLPYNVGSITKIASGSTDTTSPVLGYLQSTLLQRSARCPMGFGLGPGRGNGASLCHWHAIQRWQQRCHHFGES